MKCSNCGAELAPEDRFCGECGAPRPPVPPPIVEAELPEAQPPPPPVAAAPLPEAPPTRKRSRRRWLAVGCVGLVLAAICMLAGAGLVWVLSDSLGGITIDLGPTTIRLGGSSTAPVATRAPVEVPTLPPTQVESDTPTLSPTEGPTVEATIELFSCSFEDLDCGWETYSGGSGEVYAVGHELFLVAKGPYALVDAEIPALRVQDFYLYFVAELRSESGVGSYGVEIRCDPEDSGPCYDFELTSGGEYYVWEWVGSDPTLLDSGSAQLELTGEDSIGIFAQGPSLSFFVNDEFVAEITDAEVREGPIRLYASVTEEANVEVAVSHVVVEAP